MSYSRSMSSARSSIISSTRTRFCTGCCRCCAIPAADAAPRPAITSDWRGQTATESGYRLSVPLAAIPAGQRGREQRPVADGTEQGERRAQLYGIDLAEDHDRIMSGEVLERLDAFDKLGRAHVGTPGTN